MMTSNSVMTTQYVKYQEWVKHRQAQHERLVNQALLARRTRGGADPARRSSLRIPRPRPFSKIISTSTNSR